MRCVDGFVEVKCGDSAIPEAPGVYIVMADGMYHVGYTKNLKRQIKYLCIGYITRGALRLFLGKIEHYGGGDIRRALRNLVNNAKFFIAPTDRYFELYERTRRCLSGVSNS